ncbi:HlyD family secretion protein [Rhodovulum sp. DZ06]|uniref:HlyD family secretion protein n=1 Tax=Rhodovulum sp. DZ06 TaxID=3425126 RepID=UPI003D356C7E
MPEAARLLLRRAVAALIIFAIAWLAWARYGAPDEAEGLFGGNGRTEAVEIDIAAKSPGRIDAILVDEGDMVAEGDVVVRMDTATLDAQLHQARAAQDMALIAVGAAKSAAIQAEAEREAAQAVVDQRQAALDVAKKQSDRAAALAARGAAPESTAEDAEAAWLGARAALAAAKAQRAAADAGVDAARAQVVSAEAGVVSARATTERIEAELADAVLRAPRDGRVQYRVAQPGEVTAAGAPIVNLVDLTDLHVTFFLPTAQAGRVALGTEARIVLDAAPDRPIPARITYVADVAQFTPRTVETADERAKLMFRLKARIDPELLARHETQVKTGLPGMVWLREDPSAPWPTELALPAPEAGDAR